MIDANNANGDAGSGGGVLVKGALTVTDSTISNNKSKRAGGGIEAAGGAATVNLTGVRLTGNATASAPGNGGGLHATGAIPVNVNGSLVRGNTADVRGRWSVEQHGHDDRRLDGDQEQHRQR